MTTRAPFPLALTEKDLREYVEAELDRTVRTAWPRLYVDFQKFKDHDLPLTSPLWWSIRSTQMDRSQHLLGRNYVLEARLEQREFVVWFGALSGFSWPPEDPRPSIFPAVHLQFPSEANPRPHCGIGAVLLRMLQHEANPDAPWDPIIYPMNGGRY
jgi:hypothetical protein